MKLPKGAEFKYEFPSKRKKLKNPDPERLDKRKLELDHYFGDLSEWGRSNGMAVRLHPPQPAQTSADWPRAARS